MRLTSFSNGIIISQKRKEKRASCRCTGSTIGSMAPASNLPGYSEKDSNGKRRYLEKLREIDGLDPYETARSKYIDLWPSMTKTQAADLFSFATYVSYTSHSSSVVHIMVKTSDHLHKSYALGLGIS